MISGWMTQAKGHSVVQVATALGLTVDRDAVGPCPACDATARGSEDRRGPLGTTANGLGWRCHRCKATGNAIELVSLALGVEPKSAETRAWFAERGLCEPSGSQGPQVRPLLAKPQGSQGDAKESQAKPQGSQAKPEGSSQAERGYLPANELAELLATAPPLTTHALASDWVRSRGLDPELLEERGLLRVLPEKVPAWARKWPAGGYLAVLPMYDAAGVARNVRVRRVASGDGPKARSPWRRAVRGLVFANATGIAMLETGTVEPGAQVYIVEGGPDFLTVASWLSETSPDVVLGIGSGQWTRELAERIPDGTPVLACTDPNETGWKYAKGVAQSLDGRCPVKVPDIGAPDPRDLNDRWREEGPGAFDPTAGLIDHHAGGDDQDNPSSCCIETPDGRPYLVAAKGSAKGLYVATHDGYVFVTNAFVQIELERLWPDLTTRNEDGDPYGLGTLYQLYGRRADQVFFSYTDRTRFDKGPNNGGSVFMQVVHDAPPPPVFHPEVDEWLRLTFNERTLDWLATMPRLDRPTGVLWLYGPKGLGKSMIGEACARYFGSAVTDYDDVFKGRFNDALLRCPVIHLDEKAEVKTSSGVMRKRVGNSRHAIEAKNEPSGTLVGCTRQVWSSNNPDPANLGSENLTRYDNDAIGDRILIVDCNPAAEAWLAECGGRDFTEEWVERKNGKPGLLVEHIAWLVQHRDVKAGPRFLVTGDAEEWTARIGSRDGLPRAILDALVGYLEMTSPERQFIDDRYPPFRWHPDYPDTVLVSVPGLIHHWRSLVGSGHPVPTQVAAGKALQLLTRTDRPIRPLWNGSRIRAYPLANELVERHKAV